MPSSALPALLPATEAWLSFVASRRTNMVRAGSPISGFSNPPRNHGTPEKVLTGEARNREFVVEGFLVLTCACLFFSKGNTDAWFCRTAFPVRVSPHLEPYTSLS